MVVVNAKTKRVGYLSQTYAGKIHDKKIVDTEAIRYPRAAILYQDTGFQGYAPAVSQVQQPKKSHARGSSLGGKSGTIASCRASGVRVEHALAGVKRSRIVKDCLRNTKRGFSDLVMVVACGLHNLRVRHRKRRLRT